MSWKKREVFGGTYQRKNNEQDQAMDCLRCGKTQDEEMLPEFRTGSLGKELHNPFRWEMWGTAEVRKKKTKILVLDSFYVMSTMHPNQNRKPIRMLEI